MVLNRAKFDARTSGFGGVKTHTHTHTHTHTDRIALYIVNVYTAAAVFKVVAGALVLNDQGKLRAQWWCRRKAAIDIENAEIKIFLFRLFDTLICTGY